MWQMPSGWQIRRPNWEMQLEQCEHEVLRDVSLSKEELYNVLEVLYQHRVIN